MAAARPLSPDEVKKMMQTRAFHTMGSFKRNCALLIMQVTLGPRIHELLALTVGDVIERNGKMRDYVYFRKTKDDSPRAVDMTAATVKYLLPHLAELEEQGLLVKGMPLFPARAALRSISRQQVYRIYTAAARECGLERISTHSPRKAWAVSCYNLLCDERAKGRRVEPLMETQKLGGWKKVDSVTHYLASTSHWGKYVQSQIFKEAGF